MGGLFGVPNGFMGLDHLVTTIIQVGCNPSPAPWKPWLPRAAWEHVRGAPRPFLGGQRKIRGCFILRSWPAIPEPGRSASLLRPHAARGDEEAHKTSAGDGLHPSR